MNPKGSSRAHGDAHQNWRKSLRNAAINYRNGWFFVTCQVAHNKSIFGAIVGERSELNDLGRRVEEYWRAMPSKYPELELDEFVLMPNHFHAIVRVHYRPTNKEQHLGFLMGRFKGGTGFIYGKLRRSGEVEDIGEHLWQQDYWDKIVTNESQLAAYRKYIRENPSNWTRDRFGAVTQYAYGNIDLLKGPRVAFVASRRRCHIGVRGFSPAALGLYLHKRPGTRSAAMRHCQGSPGNPGNSARHTARK